MPRHWIGVLWIGVRRIDGSDLVHFYITISVVLYAGFQLVQE
jgi:hypothetical protein